MVAEIASKYNGGLTARLVIGGMFRESAVYTRIDVMAKTCLLNRIQELSQANVCQRLDGNGRTVSESD